MAKIVFSAVVGDARKKAGGVVFTKSRSGAVVRRKVSPVQPRTAAQSAVRANFTAMAKRWGSTSLTDAQRAAWNALAGSNPQKDKFGASHTLTGLQMYQKLNRNRFIIGQPPLDDPPASLSCGFPGDLTVIATSPGTLTVNPATHEAAGENALVYAAAQQSAGRTFVGSRYRFIDNFGTGGGWPFDISAKYVTAFGALISGKKIAVKVKYITIATGATGTPITALQVVS